MSKAAQGRARAKQAEVERLVAAAADKHEQEKMVADQQAVYERRVRENNIFAACRSRIINEPALWYRAPDHEGAMIGEFRMIELQKKMEAMVREQMAERGVVVPDGTVKFSKEEEHGS